MRSVEYRQIDTPKFFYVLLLGVILLLMVDSSITLKKLVCIKIAYHYLAVGEISDIMW